MGIPKVETKQTQVFMLDGEVVTRTELEALRGHITNVLDDVEDFGTLVVEGFNTDYGGVDGYGFGRTTLLVRGGRKVKIATTPDDLELSAQIMRGKGF